MSAALDLRNQIKAALVAADIGLTATDIVVDRQQDILKTVEKTVAIASNGVACTILPAEGRTVDPDSETLLMDLGLTITLWLKPIYNVGSTPEEDIHEGLMAALHHLTLAVHTAGGARQVWQRLKVTGFADVTDPDYLRRDTRITTEVLS